MPDKIMLTGGFEAEIVSMPTFRFDDDEESNFVWSDEPVGTWRLVSIGDEEECDAQGDTTSESSEAAAP